MGGYDSGSASQNDRDEDDEEEYEEGGGNQLLGFMFGNVDNSGDLDVDYLDEDAKEHLSALADKLGASLTDIDLSEKSPHTPADTDEQDYVEKAEDAVDYEDIDEQYEGPEIQAVSEEDYLLPKKDYFSAEISLATLEHVDSVFDDENYDEDEECEKDHDVVERKSETGTTISAVSEGEKSLDHEQLGLLDTENLLEGVEDVPEEVTDILEGPLDGQGSTPLPILCIEDGMVILRFSEIFGIHEPLKKEEKGGHRYFTYKEKYKSMDISDLVEEDEEAFLKGHGNGVSFINQAEVFQHDISIWNDDSSELLKSGPVRGAAPMSMQFDEQRKDSCASAEPMEEDLTVNISSGWQSQLYVNIFPLDQQDWEQGIVWDSSPAFGDYSVLSSEFPEPDSEALFVRETEPDTGPRNFLPELSPKLHGSDHNILMHNSSVFLESFGSRKPSGPTNLPNYESRFHPQLLRLESRSEVDDPNQEDAVEDLQSDSVKRSSILTLQNRDMMDESWLDNIIWEPQKAIAKPKLILDLQDEQMLFEMLDEEDSKHLRLRAGAMIISRSVKPSNGDSFELQGHKYQTGWQFNISNDKFYMNGKSSQQLQSNSNKHMVHSFKIHHSAPALKLQTMKLKLSNKDIANFHRPKALWYPHLNEVAVKEQGKLPTQGPMKIIIKSLGGKGSKLHVDAEETVLSVKVKASKKLDFKPTETVKMFYLGKELEDDKSLSAQNVQPNSLVHLVRTKIHLWPKAQKLPGESKSLRPPGAFKKKSDLSMKDGHVVLMEYCEERPLLLSNVGMGGNMCTYYQKSAPGDQGDNLCNGNNSLGNVLFLEPGDKSPFLGDIRAGCSQLSLETNMYKAPIFSHKVPSTDYLLVRSAKGKLTIRRIDRIAVVGQQEPLMEVMSPGSKNLQTYMVNRMLVYVYREFATRGLHPFISVDELSSQFPNLSEFIIRKKMKDCASLKRGKNGQPCWYMKPDFHIASENELRKMATPEHVCAYESMQAGLYRLKHLGITRLTLPASISSAMTQLPDEAIALAAASHIERELQITPWNLSSNFVASTNQDRGNIERLEITGVGDPSGRGLGFSYVRAAPKAPISGALLKKKSATARGGSTVTGTDADLRRLSMEAAREVLLKFNVPEELIAKQTRWHRIAMIRKLSSEQAASGVKVDPTTISKYARGQRMSFLQLQQQTREKCQEIWDRQVQSLSAVDDDDDNESDSEANSDLDSFAGDLENLLDAEEFAEGEEGNNLSKHEKLEGVKGLKMRRRPSQVQVEEENEDEAAEAAELFRLLMDDEDVRKKKMKKKKAKAVAVEALAPGLRSSVGHGIAERVKKTNGMAKKSYSTTQPDGSYTRSENIVKDPTNVESLILKRNMSAKEKTIKKNGMPFMGELKKVKILGDKVKMFKEKKSARESFVCGACGQLGHMRTNKNCPKYGEDTETQLETTDFEKSSGKSNSLDPSGLSQLKTMRKKLVSKSVTKISAVEAPEAENLSSKTNVLPLKFRCGPADKQSEKLALGATESSDQVVISDVDTGSKSVSKISKIIISNKAKPEEAQAESDKPSHMIRPPVNTEREHVESHKPSIVIRPPVNTEREQVESHKPSVVIRPPINKERDQVESHRPFLVIRPQTEKDREQPQKKIIIKRSKEITDHDQISQDGSPRLQYRKTKRIVELGGVQKHGKQEGLRLIEESSKRKAREERRLWEEEERWRTAERLKEEGANRLHEEKMGMLEEQERFTEIKKYEDAIRREREEEERQKAKKKKKKKKKPEIRDDYIDDFRARRNDRRMPERDRSAKRRPVVELGRYGAEYAPPTKRRRGGEVGLANILERIVETLKSKGELSFLFLKPVSKKDAPDYMDIIERPMDLSTIRDKVRRIEYKGREEFRHDVWQIAYNAHKYNDGRNPGIPPLADQLLELCDYLLEENNEGLNEVEAGIESRD